MEHYKTQMLNIAETCLAPTILCYGLKTASEAMAVDRFRKFTEKLMLTEIIPTIDINKNVLEGYANAITLHFSESHNDLNGTIKDSALKLRTLVLPVIFEYERRFNKLPTILVFSIAMTIAFYKNGGRYKINDEEKNIAFLRDNKVDIILKNTSVWGMDLTENVQLFNSVEETFKLLKKHGVNPMLERIV
jgi:tagaturonate reductase